MDSEPRSSLLDAARSYLATGLSVVPAIAAEKRPTLPGWKEYQKRLPNPDELDQFFQGRANAVALVCGDVSNDLEVIDYDLQARDFEEWHRRVEDAHPGLFARLVIEDTPSGGKHVFYRCAEPVGGNLKLAKHRFEAENADEIEIAGKHFMPRRDATGRFHVEVASIETRGEGGLCLCDPSPGYHLRQGSFCELPVISGEDREILISCARALNTVFSDIVDGRSGARAVETEVFRPGDDFNRRGDIRPILEGHGWSLVREGRNQYWRRPSKSMGTSATLKDGVFYVFTTNAPPFDPETPYSLFAVFALLEHGGDYSAAAMALVQQGYGRASRTEVRADVRRAPTDPGNNDSELVEAALRPQPLSAAELSSHHPELRPAVIEGLLRRGETMNVIAAPKIGKSWTTIDMALCLAAGQPWLNHYPTTPSRVLIIDNELHPETTAFRIRKVAQAKGIDLAGVGDMLLVDNLRGRLENINRLGPYFSSFDPQYIQVVILDAFYRFLPQGESENDNSVIAHAYNAIDRYAAAIGASFVPIHHSTKGLQSEKSVTDVGAGAGAQSRAADTHLILRPHKERDVVVLDAVVRSWPPVEPICLEWSFPLWRVNAELDPEDLAAPLRRRRGKPCGGSRTQATTSPPWDVDRFVQKFIGSNPVPNKTLKGLVAETENLSWRQAENLLASAEHKGIIRTCPLPGRGAPKGYLLSSAFLEDHQQPGGDSTADPSESTNRAHPPYPPGACG